MIRLANKHRVEKQFQVGDWVWLKLLPYVQTSVVERPNQKLAKRYFGPYQIVKKIGTVAYKLQLPENSKIHLIFHVSLLKHFKGDLAQLSPMHIPEPQSKDEPVAIVDQRPAKEGNPQVLVEWHGKPREEATWEPMDQLLHKFASLNLEDKVVSQGVQIVALDAEPSEANHVEKEAQARSKRDKKKPGWMSDYWVQT